MNKMGQIRGTPKWLRSRNKMPLQAELLPAADIFLRYLCHFDAAKVDLIGPDPSLRYFLKRKAGMRLKPLNELVT